jgi:hypothetical protein
VELAKKLISKYMELVKCKFEFCLKVHGTGEMPTGILSQSKWNWLLLEKFPKKE